jgi:hypothetical protein
MYDDDQDSNRVNCEFAAMLLDPASCLAYSYVEEDDTRRSENIVAGLTFIADIYTEQQQRLEDMHLRAAEIGGGSGRGVPLGMSSLAGKHDNNAHFTSNPLLHELEVYAPSFLLSMF